MKDSRDSKQVGADRRHKKVQNQRHKEPYTERQTGPFNP